MIPKTGLFLEAVNVWIVADSEGQVTLVAL
jgi:hypothetical protein